MARLSSLRLRLRHRSDPRMTFVDCCNASLMVRNGLEEILTADPHYRELCDGIRLLPEDEEGGDG